MSEIRIKPVITAFDFGVPAEFVEHAENYARWCLSNTLGQQAEHVLEVERMPDHWDGRYFRDDGGSYISESAIRKLPIGTKLYTTPPIILSQPVQKPLSDEQIEKLRDKTFSINNPFCPVDSKSMRKVV